MYKATFPRDRWRKRGWTSQWFGVGCAEQSAGEKALMRSLQGGPGPRQGPSLSQESATSNAETKKNVDSAGMVIWGMCAFVGLGKNFCAVLCALRNVCLGVHGDV